MTGKTRKITNQGPLFTGHFIEVKAFYVTTFGKVPCVHFISELDVSQAYSFITKQMSQYILETYQHAYFDHEKQRMLFNNTIFVLKENRMIELANSYAQILFMPDQYTWAHRLTKDISVFRKIAEPEIQRNRIIGFARPPSEPV